MELKVALALQNKKYRYWYEERTVNLDDRLWKVPDFTVRVPIFSKYYCENVSHGYQDKKYGDFCPKCGNRLRLEEETKQLWIEVESFSTKRQIRSFERKIPKLRGKYPDTPLIVVTHRKKAYLAEGLCDRVVHIGRRLEEDLDLAIRELLK